MFDTPSAAIAIGYMQLGRAVNRLLRSRVRPVAGSLRRQGEYPMSHGTMMIRDVTWYRGVSVSPRRWLRAVAVIGATVDADGLQLYLAAQPLHPRRRAAARRGIRCRRWTPTPTAGPRTSCADWAQQRAPALEIPVIALEAYALRRPGRRGGEPEVPYRVDDAGRHRAGGEPSRHLSGRDAGRRTATCVRRSGASVLDGTGGNLRIVDSEAGRMDGDAGRRARDGADAVHSRDLAADTASTPTTTARSARTTSTMPRLSAAGYLCWRGKDLATPRGWITALRAYNNSGVYARAVRDWATAYAAGHPL